MMSKEITTGLCHRSYHTVHAPALNIGKPGTWHAIWHRNTLQDSNGFLILMTTIAPVPMNGVNAVYQVTSGGFSLTRYHITRMSRFKQLHPQLLSLHICGFIQPRRLVYNDMCNRILWRYKCFLKVPTKDF